MVSLNELDRRILFELDKDARQPLSRLASRISISKDVANYRMKKLVETGVIRKFYAVVNFHKLGYLPFRIFLKLHNLTHKKMEEMVNELVSSERVGWVVSCEGNWDLNIMIWARNLYDFHQFWKGFLERYGTHIEDKWVSIIHTLRQYTRMCLIGEDKPMQKKEMVSRGLPIELDSLDWEIIKILGENARESLLNMAKKLNVTPKAVDYRLKKLMKNDVVQGFRILPNLELLGYKYYKVHFRFSNFNKERVAEITKYARLNPAVVYIDEMIGGADFELEFQVSREEILRKTLADMRDRFSDLIRDFETMYYYNEHKLVWVPPRIS
ncbi:Lrp/AsnC family transcriptional regulator [Candidatus Micrarchaeota archaeon]|nr:Lrp/AsnC family transcriptional regulator [Candidatus Micrarchaeota archaeon]